MIESGDIFATPNNSLIGKLARKLIRPYNDRFHYGLVWENLGDGYLILESVGKGIAVGRLSFYDGQDVKFYRVDCPSELRYSAPYALTKHGRSKYDYLLILRIIVQGLWTVFKNLLKGEGIHPIRAEDLSWARDNSFVCTEAVDEAYKMVGVSIIPYGVCPIPAAFRQAELEGRISEQKRS